MLTWFQGKKVYIVSILSILGAIGAYLAGDMTVVELFNSIQLALSAMGLRAGVAKIGK